jgi:hypothetical protein
MELLDLLGKLLGGPEVQGFIDRAGEHVQVQSIEGCHYLKFKNLGVSLSTEEPDARVRTIHIYCEPTDGYSSCQGALPFGLRTSFTSSDVRALLGSPSQCSCAKQVTVLGTSSPW